MPLLRQLERALVFVCFAVFLSYPVYAQVGHVNDTTSTPIPGAGHDYIRLLSETVNPANGSVSMRIEIPMPKGRGISIPFAFGYDSNSAHHLEAQTYPNYGKAYWASNNDAFAQGGWSNSWPTLRSDTWEEDQYVLTGVNQGQPVYTAYPCYYGSNYIFRDLTGGVHALNLGALSWSSGNPPPSGCPGVPKAIGGDAQFGASLTTNSQTGMVLPNPVTVSDSAGTTYIYTAYRGTCAPAGSCFGPPDYIEDRNGNKAVFTQNGVTDTLGRLLISGTGLGASGTTQTVSFSGGLNYYLTWTSASANFSVPYAYVGTNVGPNSVNDTCYSAVPPANDTQTVVSQIKLPDNMQQYHFYYGTDNPNPSFQNPYGLLSEIDYPSGAWVRYTWKLSDTMNELADYPGAIINSCGNGGASYCPSPVRDGCAYQYASPVVASRQVGVGGSSSPVLTQTFTYYTSWAAATSGNVGGTSWTQKTTKVTTTDNVTGRSTLTTYSYTPIALQSAPFNYTDIPAQMPVEATTTLYDWGNTTTPLRTVNKTWYDQFNLASQQTILETGQSSKTTYCYVGSNCVPSGRPQLQEIDEYDFGATSPTRKTITTYQSFTNAPGVIADAPCKVDVYTAGSSPIAETQYFYDGGSSLCGTPGTPSVGPVSNLPAGTHDETNYGPNSTVSRGNVTKLTKICLPNCPDPATVYTYDETGQLLSFKDPKGNTTQYSYVDNFDSPPLGNTNAYMTQITFPPTNGVSHIDKFKYAYADGQVIQSVDQNNQVTNYLYNDSLRRLKETQYPDGGKTTLSYNDAPYNPSTPSPSVTTTKAITSTPNLVNLVMITALDGLGHVVKTLLTDPDCASGDRTDTTYDGLGRVYTVSNPYCTTSDPPYTYNYDGLGRTTQVTKPDGSTVLTTYFGRATQVQDEGNGTQRVTRISQVDGLGRLTSVCEVASGPFVGSGGSSSASLIGPGGTPAACGLDIQGTGFSTTYEYDALDNLRQVNQNGVAPRTFAYDSLSRLASATNPESGTISYTYDANGNLATKVGPAPNQTGSATVTTTYSYDALNRVTQKLYSDGVTPTATFTYDTSSIWGQNYPGNPIGRLVATSASCAATIYEHDPMGRIKYELQETPLSCDPGRTTWAPYQINYTYDLMGNMTSHGDGYFHTYTHFYNSAGRLTSLTSSLSDSVHFPATLVSGMQYDAAGRLTSDTLGDGEIEAFSYDKRGRQQSASAMLNTTPIYSFNISGFAPNGDVLSTQDSANGNWTYGYDSFNRLTCSNLASNGTCPAPTSGTPTYTYVYDRFGNRWQQNGPNSMIKTFTGNNPGNPANNNRVDGLSYDAAGNVLNDGTHSYTYDAENRLTKVDGGATATYIYNAEGNRARRTGVITDTCDSTGTRDYVYDLSGRWVLEVDFGGTACNYEIYAGSRHLGSYGGDTFFSHTDWLGTERSRESYYYRNNYGPQTCASLPFGDALSCVGTSISTLHFTGKERDSESGLDNFGARYDSSSMGRFMTPDPLLNSGRPNNPQSWNRYAYALNNPLNIIDPTGLYDLVNNCAQDDKKCNKQFEQHAKDLKNGISDLQKKVDKMKDGPEKTRLEAALKAMGTEGDHNGVNATFGAVANGAAETTFGYNEQTNQVTANVTFDPSKISGSNHYAIDAAHEGTHIADTEDPRYNNPATTLSPFAGEYRAYQTSAWAASALGLSSLGYGGGRYPIWNSSWAAVDDKVLTRFITDTYKYRNGQHYEETKPHNPWDN